MKEVLLVTDKKQPRKPGTEGHPRCQIDCNPDGTPAFCAEPGKVEVDGLLLCEGHALEAKLEGQVYCWDEMLFYVDLCRGRQPAATGKTWCGSLKYIARR